MGESKTASLKSKRDFEKVYAQGRAIKNDLLVMLILKNGGTGQSRVGYSVSRKLGGAVERNRIRRRLKEAFRLSGLELNKSTDIVFIARRKIKGKSYHEIEKALRRLTRRAEDLIK
ncbi:MAG: ribonuclease P protein component [Actinomycetota bacterium]|nr:ribonuclease P protein component [Actinomycetota bacterium]